MWQRSFVLGSACLVAMWACGSNTSSPGDPGGTAAGGMGGGSESDGGGGASAGNCGAPCDPGTFCSTTGICIADGTCASNADCMSVALECNPDTGSCEPGGGCGATEVVITPVPPNLMIALDRSCSMRRDLDDVLNIAGPNKWTFSVDAINKMTTDYDDEMRFGLILFPDTTPSNCAQDAPAVAVGVDNELTIQTLLTAALDTADVNYPNGPCVTNIDSAMEQVSQQVELTDPDRPNYALLITDGRQAGCNLAGGDSGTESILAAMHAAGISTFVVGFGGGVDPAQLDAFAIAGGVPLATSPAYYQADDAMELEAALEAIANEALSCVFDLDDVPGSVDDIFVFLDNSPTPVDRDPVDGWDYDPATNQVELFGQLCEDLKNGDISDIDIVLGCPEPTPD